MEKQFKKGDLIIYVNGDRYEIGKVKRVCDDGCFVYYHSGEPLPRPHMIACIQYLMRGIYYEPISEDAMVKKEMI